MGELVSGAVGSILGLACGDALGAIYEFGPPLPKTVKLNMIGSSLWEPGEWTDDTSMAIPLLQAAAQKKDLSSSEVLETVIESWKNWAEKPKDIGILVGTVLAQSTYPYSVSQQLRIAEATHSKLGHSGGNGSLMRTAPVVLSYLRNLEGLTEAARLISDLTHYESDAGDSCVIWSHAIREAIVNQNLSLESGVLALPSERQKKWFDLIEAAEKGEAVDFINNNGRAIMALQGAWASINQAVKTSDNKRDLFVDSIENAVRGGKDTDTVAAITGSLIGAYCGEEAVPEEWFNIIHGWPGYTAEDLKRLAVNAVDS